MIDQLQAYVDAIVADFEGCPGRAAERVEEFRNKITIVPGKKYIKVVTDNSVHSFVVAVDTDKQFAKGDILRAASWKAPARNAARGNIFGEYQTNWTGAPYIN